MRALRTLLMLLGVLATLGVGALPAAAGAETSPPCHEATAHHGDQAPASTPDEALKAMDCCVACVAAPTLRAPEPARMAAPRPPAVIRPAALPAGECPAPEPHPPRAADF